MLGKIGGRALPGVGAGLYGYDAVQRARRGDWGGAALQGLGAGLSLVPGVGTLAALAPGAINMATDAMGLTGNKSKGQPGYKPPATSTPSTPAATSTGTGTSTPAATKPRNTTVLALKGGVQGKLDKATGKFTAGNFSDAERARYTAAGGKIPSAKPATTAGSSAGVAAGKIGSRAAGNMSNLKTGVAMSGNAGKIAGASGTMKGMNTSMSLKPQTSGSLSNLKQGVKATGSSRLNSALASVKPMNSGNKVNTSMSVKPQMASAGNKMTAAGNKSSDLAALRAKAKNDTLARARM